jgi:hypothetical protein
MYKRMMEHWKTFYSERMYSVDYEKLTITPVEEAKKLIEYLDLSWEDACSKPHKNIRSVRTASNQQVRKKIYQGSSASWQKFKPYINDTFDALN